MANRFRVSPLGGLNVGQSIDRLGQALQARNEAERQQQMQKDMQDAILGARQGDPQSMDMLFSMNPSLAMTIEENARQLDREGRLEATKNAAIQWAGSEPGSMEREMLKERFLLDEKIDFGEDEQNMTDEQFDLATNLFLQQQGYDFGRRQEDSMPAETRAFEELIKDFSPEQKKKAKLVRAGLEGRAVSNAVLSAIESGDVNNLAEANALIKEQEKFASSTGASRAKYIDSGYETINKINKNIGNLTSAIEQIDNGAMTGFIESKFFPSIKAASRELNRIQNELALDVIGSVTFGALSEGELKLAKETALDTGLSEKDLRESLSKKREAQEKLKRYFEEQIDHLDKGGTVASFIRMKKRQQEQSEQAQEPQQAQPQQPQQSIEELLKKYGNP